MYIDFYIDFNKTDYIIIPQTLPTNYALQPILNTADPSNSIDHPKNSNITVDNLLPISTFLGKIGDKNKGGLSLDEFLKRQKMHKDAEIKAMLDVPEFIEKSRRIYSYDHFINDAGGSICELNNTKAMETLIEHTLILYIEDDEGIRDALIERARKNPKPMYYTEEFLIEHLDSYCSETGETNEEIDPDDFVRWVFPKLLDYRKEKYEDIANNYGYRVTASDVASVENESDFLNLINNSIKDIENG